MSQAELIILMFKISLIAVIISTLAFIIIYTKLAPWWKSSIGRTLVLKDIMLLMAFIPSTLSLFFHFSRLTSNVAAYIDIGTFFGIAAIMVWRIKIWVATHRQKDPHDIS